MNRVKLSLALLAAGEIVKVGEEVVDPVDDAIDAVADFFGF